MSLAIAQNALKFTRDLLKPSLKASNKGYDPGVIEAAAQKFKYRNTDVDIVARWDNRNAKRQLAFDRKSAQNVVVDVANLSALDAGARLYNAARDNQAAWYGNCGEQASVALYACNQVYGVGPDDLFLITYKHKTSNFSHSHVIVGEGQLVGSFKKLVVGPAANTKEPSDDPTVASDRREIITRFMNDAAFCDPWLGVACLAKDYPDRARQKLDQWSDEGKRIHERQSTLKGRTIAGFYFEVAPQVVQHWWRPNGGEVTGFWGGSNWIFNAREVPRLAGS